MLLLFIYFIWNDINYFNISSLEVVRNQGACCETNNHWNRLFLPQKHVKVAYFISLVQYLLDNFLSWICWHFLWYPQKVLLQSISTCLSLFSRICLLQALSRLGVSRHRHSHWQLSLCWTSPRPHLLHHILLPPASAWVSTITRMECTLELSWSSPTTPRSFLLLLVFGKLESFSQNTGTKFYLLIV